MIKSKKIQLVLAKQMTRKEFLQHLGLFFVGIAGISTAINQFAQLSNYQPGKKVASLQRNGYGSQPYGR
jgi:hypothetical protein